MGDKLIARVRGVMVSPAAELPKTIAEAGDLRTVLYPYVVVLVSIGAIAQFIARGLIGVYVPPALVLGMKYGGGWMRAPGHALALSALGVVIGCAGWWLFSFVLVKLAPGFGGRSDEEAARKAAAYIATPLWLAGVLTLFSSIPYLAIVSVVGHIAAFVYAILIGLQALPLLLGTPEDKAVGHTLAALGITAVTVVIAFAVLFALLAH